VKRRIAGFTPEGMTGKVTGYMIVGATSGGFAFGDTQFCLNLDRFPHAVLASTIMQHELFHAVQALARSANAAMAKRTSACLVRTDHAHSFTSRADPSFRLMIKPAVAWTAGTKSQ